MNKKELAEWKSRVSMSPSKWAFRSNLWRLADEILGAGEITDELFKRIGKMLAKKIWFWESIRVTLDRDIII